jgi:hypothetical protein
LLTNEKKEEETGKEGLNDSIEERKRKRKGKNSQS